MQENVKSANLNTLYYLESACGGEDNIKMHTTEWDCFKTVEDFIERGF
jgi:hypothetical protein